MAMNSTVKIEHYVGKTESESAVMAQKSKANGTISTLTRQY